MLSRMERGAKMSWYEHLIIFMITFIAVSAIIASIGVVYIMIEDKLIGFLKRH